MIMGLPWYVGNGAGNMREWWWGFPGVIVPFVLWSIIWTGLALWHAAQRQEKGWFIFFLIVHTAGLVELLYLFFVAGSFNQKKTPRRRK